MLQFHELPAARRYYIEPALENTVGYIPQMVDEHDSRPAVRQLHEGYAHGGGWRPFKGFVKTGSDPLLPSIQYPGDPVFPPLAYADLRGERIIVYPFAWVMILQRDSGEYEISRMD